MKERQERPELTLRPLRLDDEAAFIAAHEEMAGEGFTFGLGYEAGESFVGYVGALEAREGPNPPGRWSHWVRSSFLVAEVGGVIVGRSSIRFELNDFLAHEGGHIGYGVLAAHRRRGYATEILRQSILIAREEGVDRVLVTCDDDNTGSATVIERCGGVLDSVVTGAEGNHVRRYWIGGPGRRVTDVGTMTRNP